MKKLLTLFSLFAIVSCSSTDEGKVISKNIDPANTYRVDDFKQGGGIVVVTEKDSFDDLDYVLMVEPLDGSDAFEVEVDSVKWYNTNIGDFYKGQ